MKAWTRDTGDIPFRGTMTVDRIPLEPESVNWPCSLRCPSKFGVPPTFSDIIAELVRNRRDSEWTKIRRFVRLWSGLPTRDKKGRARKRRGKMTQEEQRKRWRDAARLQYARMTPEQKREYMARRTERERARKAR